LSRDSTGTALAIAVVMHLRRAMAAFCLVGLWTAALGAQSTVVELNEAGWKALRDGHEVRSEALFAEALTLRPNDPILLLGAAAAAHAQGKQREAMARLQLALEKNPRLTDASRLLGRIAYEEGEVELAIRTGEKALTLAPGDPELKRELETWRRDADVHHAFEEVRYDRFRVMFEGRAEQSLAAQATSMLDSAFRRIGAALGEYPTDTIVAVLYTEQQFRDITRAPEWSGGRYDGRIRIPAAGAALKPALFERVLAHELTHAIVASIAPRHVPTWLNEGLAQHLDGTDPQPAQRRMKMLGRSVPLKQLEGSFGQLSAAQAQVAYDESLLAVNVMFDRPGFGWTRLLRELADGASFEHAIGRFGFSYPDLEVPFAR
jgi:tetratricopeptide (TPR) repeat protein